MPLHPGHSPLAGSPGECGQVSVWGGPAAAGAHKSCGGVELRGKAVGLADAVGWPGYHRPARAEPWSRGAPAGCRGCPREAVPEGAAEPLPRCPENGSAQCLE